MGIGSQYPILKRFISLTLEKRKMPEMGLENLKLKVLHVVGSPTDEYNFRLNLFYASACCPSSAEGGVVGTGAYQAGLGADTGAVYSLSQQQQRVDGLSLRRRFSGRRKMEFPVD